MALFIMQIKKICVSVKPMITTLIFLFSALSLVFNPFAISRIIGFSKFDRQMGSATLVGIDASTRIQLFQLFNIVFIPVVLLITIFFCYFFIPKNKDFKSDCNIDQAFSFLNSISVCALAMTTVFILNKYNISTDLSFLDVVKTTLQQYSVLAFPLIIVMTMLVYIRIPFIKFEIYRFGILISIGLSLFVNFLFQSSIASDQLSSTLRFYLIFMIITVGVMLFLRTRIFSDYQRLQLAFVPMSFGMFFAGLSLEIFNILNQHGIYVIDRIGGAKLVFVVFILLGVLVFIFANAKLLAKLKTAECMEMVAIIGLLLSLYYFVVIPPLDTIAGVDLFEQANHGLLANDFLAWGKFPMINSFDAHTLSYSLGMLLYGVLNGDVLGASYYTEYAFIWILPTIICTFFVYKNIFDKYFAFFLILIAPILFPFNVTIGTLCIAMLIYAMKKRSFISFEALFFSVLVAVLYNIPNGFAYGGAVLIVATVVLIAESIKLRKLTNAFKSFLKAFGVFSVIVIVLYVGICLQQGIDPIKRVREFLDIAMSTNTWSYASLGDQTSVTFGLLYSVLPLVCIVCLIWLCTHFKNIPVYLAACGFLTCYVLNWTRSLQRHTLAENEVDLTILTAIIGIALFIVTVIPKNKHIAFVVGGMLVTTGIFNMNSLQTQNLDFIARAAISSVNNSANYYKGANEKTMRVDVTAPFQDYDHVIKMINTVIPEGQTYLDLTGQTMLYALSGREKPVYLNQSVAEIGGEYSQKRLIEEIEKEYDGICDFALVNTDLWTMNIDGISGRYRYYYVMEYLYDNFTPLCKTFDNYALWVRNIRHDEFPIDNDIEKKQEYMSLPLNISNANNLTIKSTVPLVVECGKKDPSMYLKFDSPLELTPLSDVIYELELTYRSSVSGMCQTFFDYEGYNEKDSIKTSLFSTSEYSVVSIPIVQRDNFTSLNSIRIDPPNNAEFEIKSLRIVKYYSKNSKTVFFDAPIMHSGLTDGKMLFPITQAKDSIYVKRDRFANTKLFPQITQIRDLVYTKRDPQIDLTKNLIYAKRLFSSTGSANVINIITNSEWIQIETDQDASMFVDGVTGAEISTRKYSSIDYNYLGMTHSISIGQIPYLWGQYDNKKSWKNKVVDNSLDITGPMSNKVQADAKYAMISINSSIDGNAVLSFQNDSGENVSVFNFSLVKGNNRYMIRCSTDWWWNRDVIKSYRVEYDIQAKYEGISFLVGD